MTKVNCDLLLCKYNSSCCLSPDGEEHYCTRENVKIIFDEEVSSVDCASYSMATTKQPECVKCQIKKYGSINMKDHPIVFDIVDSDEMPY